jgi:hypothetical protein
MTWGRVHQPNALGKENSIQNKTADAGPLLIWGTVRVSGGSLEASAPMQWVIRGGRPE